MTTIRVFFPKLGHFFPIVEKGRGRPHPLTPLVTRLNYHKYFYIIITVPAFDNQLQIMISKPAEQLSNNLYLYLHRDNAKFGNYL